MLIFGENGIQILKTMPAVSAAGGAADAKRSVPIKRRASANCTWKDYCVLRGMLIGRGAAYIFDLSTGAQIRKITPAVSTAWVILVL